MRLGLVVLCVSLSSCIFNDSRSSELIISCRGDADCPSGFTCSTARGVCRSALRTGDIEAPGLLATLSAAALRPGTFIDLTVIANEPLSGPPSVEARLFDGARALPLTDSTTSRFTFTSKPDDADQLVTFFGSAEDEAGNLTKGAALGNVRLDGTPPQLLTLTLTPTRVAPGSTAAVTARFDEVIQPGATLTVTDSAHATTRDIVFTGPSDRIVRFEVTPPPESLGTELHLAIAGVRDELGNTTPSIDAGTLSVDSDGPSITAPGLGGRVFSAVPMFNDIAVPIDVTDAEHIEVCLARECRSTDAGVTVHFTVTRTTTEGPQSLVIRAQDAVGNRAELSESIVVDLSAPIANLSLSPTAVRPSDPSSLRVTFDEPVAAGVQLQLGLPDGGQRQLTWPGPAARVVVFELPTATLNGRVALTVSGIQDAVANAAAPLDAGVLTVDPNAPVVQPLGLGGRVYSRQPGFNDVVVPVQVTGASAVTVCLGSDCVTPSSNTVHFAVDSSRSEGAQVVRLTASDEVGNRTDVTESIFFDFTPPAVASSVTRYLPRPGCPLPTVSALGRGGGIAVDITTTEELGAAQSSVTADDIVFTTTRAGRLLQAQYSNDGGLVRSDGGLVALVVDTVGNVGALVLPPLRIDQRPPTTASMGPRYRRAPWGSSTAPGVPSFLVSADAGVFEPLAHVEVWSAAVNGTLLLTADADTRGALAARAIEPAVDRPALYFDQLDDACNADGPPQKRGDVDFIVSLGGKVPGLAFPNPNRLISASGAVRGSNVVAEDQEFGGEVADALNATPARTLGPGLHWFGAQQFFESRVRQGGLANYASGAEFAAENEPPMTWIWAEVGNAAPFSLQMHAERGRWFYEPQSISFVPRKAMLSGGSPLTMRGTEVYRFDGLDWRLVPSTGTKPPTVDAWSASFAGSSDLVALAYDPDAGVTRLFNWDSPTQTWTDDTPPNSQNLPPRVGEGLAPSIDGVIAVGGRTLAGVPLQETWEYVGGDQAWHNIDMGVGPNPFDPVAAFIDTGNTLVVGSSPPWFFSLQSYTWSQPSTTFGPFGVGSYTNSDFDVVGIDELAGPLSYLGATTPPTPASDWQATLTPVPGSMASDLDAGTVVWAALAPDGGTETWVWNGAKFNQAQSVFPDAGTTTSLVMAQEPLSGRPLMVRQGSPNKVLRWTGSSWLRAAGNQPTTAPLAMATDSNRRVTVLIGSNGITSVIYEYDGTTWSVSSALPRPPLRNGPALAFDPDRNQMVFFGGQNAAGTPLNDTWEWNGTTWRQVMTPQAPPPRFKPQLAYDKAQHLMVLHGGTGFDDTWTYDGVTWRDITPTTGRPLAAGALAYDPSSRMLLLATPLGPFQPVPRGVVAQRFIPSRNALALPPTAALVSGTINLNAVATPAGNTVELSVFDSSWQRLATRSMNALEASSFVKDGLLLSTSGTGPQTLDTRLIEVTLRYLP